MTLLSVRSGFYRCWQRHSSKSAVFVVTLLVGVGDRVAAQIVPDNTLDRERSTVSPNLTIRGVSSNRIDGGASRGANLFHSFTQFSIGEGRGAYFSNPAGISNILTRVTGINRSEILGRLGVLGNANLFLINPRGIVFGTSASLDVQGSFLATTADAIRFGDTGLFSASQPTTSNLLSVSPSALWFNAVAAQPIVNRSQAQSAIAQPNSIGNPPGLQVRPERTLALIGGNVLLEGGRLNAAGGNIELGSIAGLGEVNLAQNGNRLVFGYDSVQNFGTIALSNAAFVDISGERGGDIQIRGGRLELTQGSTIRSNTQGARNGGELIIRATEVTLSETSLLGSGVSLTGTGANITINTDRLRLLNGARIATGTSGIGNSGNLQITALESIEMRGLSTDGQSSTLLSQSQSSGSAGNLSIVTGRLLVRDGAQISSSVIGEGASKGGNLQVRASESIELIGKASGGGPTTGLVAISGQNVTGNAGNIRIDTKRLTIRDGAVIAADTLGQGRGGNLQIRASESIELIGRAADGRISSSLLARSLRSGDAGDVSIETNRLILRNGARISNDTFGTGKGGSLRINATDSVELSGQSINGQSSSVLSQGLGSGNAGNLRIDTGRLLVQDGAVISSASVGGGRAGDINITARDALRSNNSSIETFSTGSDGGNITIEAGTIRLFGDSNIRSESVAAANNGGVIKLSANSILAFNDSDISAFAENGRGGNIILDTPAFFGENYRPAPPGTVLATLDDNNRVDINATGLVSGIIALPDVSFIQNSLTELPDNQINTDTILANSCIVRRNQANQGSFTITGTGGFQQRPGEAQASSFPTVSVETLPRDSTLSNTRRVWQKGDPIVEPQGMYRLPSGKIILSRNCLEMNAAVETLVP